MVYTLIEHGSRPISAREIARADGKRAPMDNAIQRLKNQDQISNLELRPPLS